MIRFNCPGCAAQFTVGDDKAGKCPKCQVQFTIPDEPNTPNEVASGLLPPSNPELPAIESTAPVEISPCPGCGSRLSVEPRDLGLDIECPNCQMQYKAIRPGDEAPAPKKSSGIVSTKSVRRDADKDEDERPFRRPSKRRDDDEEEDERPSRRSSHRSQRDEDDDDDYRRRPKRNEKPGALQAISIMLLVGGILSCITGLLFVISCYGLIWPGTYYAIVFGILAIIRASQMLGKKDNKGPPKSLCIMQIICAVNLDIPNCAMGIVGLVLMGNEDVKRYYARRGWR